MQNILVLTHLTTIESACQILNSGFIISKESQLPPLTGQSFRAIDESEQLVYLGAICKEDQNIKKGVRPIDDLFGMLGIAP